jgi:hypothetical protein
MLEKQQAILRTDLTLKIERGFFLNPTYQMRSFANSHSKM